MARDEQKITRSEYDAIARAWCDTGNYSKTARITGHAFATVKKAVDEGYPVQGWPSIKEAARTLAAKPPPNATVVYSIAAAFDKSTRLTRVAKEALLALVSEDLRDYNEAIKQNDPKARKAALAQLREWYKPSDIAKIITAEVAMFQAVAGLGDDKKELNGETVDAEVDELVVKLRALGAIADDDAEAILEGTNNDDEHDDEREEK